MYQPNFQNITGKLPVNKSNRSVKNTNSTEDQDLPIYSIHQLMKSKIKTIVTGMALVLTGFFINSCEDGGVVGGKFVQDDAKLTSVTLPAPQLSEVNSVTYSGRLGNVAIGRYTDPVFGTFESFAIMKPSLNLERVPFVETLDELELRIVFAPQQWGDTTAMASFEVFEIDEIWRGNEFQLGDQVQFDTGKKLGEFSVTSTDTVIVELDKEWLLRYRDYLESQEIARDSLYRAEFFGLAIVPTADTDSRMLFPRMQITGSTQGTDFNQTRFVIQNLDVGRRFQTVLDWASVFTRVDEGPAISNALKAHSSLEKIIEFELSLTEQDLISKNLANVELVLFENKTAAELVLPVNHVRPDVMNARIHIINTGDTGESIFSTSADFIANKDTTDNSFRFNITNYANSVLFGSPKQGKFYLSVQTVNGLIQSTLIHTGDSIESKRPKIVVTAIEQEN
jgi:hypothetical protein